MNCFAPATLALAQIRPRNLAQFPYIKGDLFREESRGTAVRKAVEKGGAYFRPARCLEGDGGSKGSDCAVCRDFPGVKGREGAGALGQPLL